jgi:hypothetical protein
MSPVSNAAAVGIHLHNHVSTARTVHVEFELSSSQVTAAAVL